MTMGEQPRERADWPAWLIGCSCLVFALLVFFFPPVTVLYLRDGGQLDIWRCGALARARWALVAGALLLPLLFRWRLAARGQAANAGAARLRRLSPLAGLPLACVALLLADRLPPAVVSNTVFFLPVLLVSVVLNRLLDDWFRKPDGAWRPWAWGAALFLAAWVFYSAAGIYLSSLAGEHVGDEAHYLIQALSLHDDGDLDLKNNLIQDVGDESRVRVKALAMHLAPQSQGGHWYSWHPFGLSLLLAPVEGGGMPARQMVLAAIAAAGCLGVFLLGVALGAHRRASLAATLTLALGAYWGLYALRALPETLGATLLVWAFWAAFVQGRRPWLSLLVAALACGFLPYGHTRFVPMSLMGIGWYGWMGLIGREAWPRKIGRLVLFTFLCAASYYLYYAIQGQLYGTSSYAVAALLFSYPMGGWGIVADSRGVMAVWPAFAWMAAATLYLLAADRSRRLYATAAATTVLACILTSSTNPVYIGGSCVPGRYLLVAAPLLVPAAACVLERTSLFLRGWLIFLAAVSAALLLLVLAYLPELGRAFILPAQNLSRFPPFYRLLHPHASFIDPPFVFTPGCLWTTLYVGSALFLTGIGLALPPRFARAGPWLLAPVILLAWAADLRLRHSPRHLKSPSEVAQVLAATRLDRAWMRRHPDTPPIPLFDLSRYVFEDVRPTKGRRSITTEDLGAREKDGVLSQPRLEANDWSGRDLRWTTLTAPFPPRAGPYLLHIGGRLEGTATVALAVNEGEHPLFEGPVARPPGPVDVNVLVQPHGKRGDLYILARLADGTGTFHLDELYWSPVNRRIADQGHIALPANILP